MGKKSQWWAAVKQTTGEPEDTRARSLLSRLASMGETKARGEA